MIYHYILLCHLYLHLTWMLGTPLTTLEGIHQYVDVILWMVHSLHLEVQTISKPVADQGFARVQHNTSGPAQFTILQTLTW